MAKILSVFLFLYEKNRQALNHKVETPYHDNDLILTPVISQ